MRSVIVSALLLTASAGAASAQALAGAPQGLDCRPITETGSEKGVSVTRSFRATDRAPLGTVAGYRCYAPAQADAAPAPRAGRMATSNPNVVIVVPAGNAPFGFNVGTSPNVLGAPQARRF